MVVTAGIEIEKLKAQVAGLRRLQFGRSSEKLEATLAQLELVLEDAEEERDMIAAPEPTLSSAEQQKPLRRPLPEHLSCMGRLRRRAAVARAAAERCAGSART